LHLDIFPPQQQAELQLHAIVHASTLLFWLDMTLSFLHLNQFLYKTFAEIKSGGNFSN